ERRTRAGVGREGGDAVDEPHRKQPGGVGVRDVELVANEVRAEPVVAAPVDQVGGVFFFQAEDGIRDYKVTGVQTCALPISWWNRNSRKYSSRGSKGACNRTTATSASAGSATTSP